MKSHEPPAGALSRPDLATRLLRLRVLWVVVFVGTTAAFAWQLPRAQLDTEMKHQLPADLATRVNLERIEELFGGTDMAMLVLSSDDILTKGSLERLERLTQSMQEVPELERIVSLFTAKSLTGEDGDMLVQPAVESLPTSPKERQALAQQLSENPLVYGNLISKDFKHAVIIGFLAPGASDEALEKKLRRVLATTPGPGQVELGGMPITRVSLTQDMRRDMRKFMPIGLGLMLVFLFLCFRQLRGVLLPFVMTVMAILFSMGLIVVLGWKIHTVTILLPVILLAVANDYGIHLLARYQEDNTPDSGLTSFELARRGMSELARPILATGATTMVGLLCLMSHLIVPAKQLGILSALGVGFAMLGSLLFIPSILSWLPRAKPLAPAGSGAKRSAGLLEAFAAWVPRVPGKILIGSLLATLAIGVGAFRLVVDTNPMSFYRETEPVWRTTHVLNEHLGGWAGVSVVVEGDIKSPKVLARLDRLEQHLKKHPKVGTTTSLAGVLRKMNQLMHNGDPKFDRLPESRQLVAQYLLLYSMSGDSKDFEKLVDFPYRHAQLMAKVTDSGTKAASDVIEYTRAYLAEQGGSPAPVVGGFLDVMADMVHHVVRGQLVSMGLAAVLVVVLVGFLLRSAVGGLLAVFPLLLALAMIFGSMGLFGIELNLVTALLSSIMIGVGIDYSIHFLWRYRDERRAGESPEGAVQRTLTTAGRGIVFNALSVVVGFVVLVVSAFYPVRFFGLLVAVAIFASLLGALLVLPAAVLLLRPKFLEPDKPPVSPSA